jgi:MFS family permease
VGVLAVVYLQEVLAYTPTFAGFAGLPFSLSVVAGSFIGSRLTGRLGSKLTMTWGLVGICAATLVTLGISAESGLWYVLSSTTLSGLALGCSAVASTTRGTSVVREEEKGLASGLLNSSAQIGTAVGLAILFTIAAAHADAPAGGEPTAQALVEGYRLAFFTGASLAAFGALVAHFVVRRKEDL